MSYRTKKGAKIAYSIFATLTITSFITLWVLGLNVATLMFWANSLTFLVSTGTCMGYLDRIEELEKRMV